MYCLPAIDLMDGAVVRLEMGKKDRKTVYSQDPVGIALRWEKEGGDWIHLVDLDAAFTGESKNLDSVRSVCQAVQIPCELGGGIRDLSSAEASFKAGVERVIVGSKAAQSLEFIAALVKEFGEEKVAVGIDAKDGMVATHGWVEVSEWSALDLAKAVMDRGVRTIVYTDISTDGMFTGPNLEAQREMLEVAGVPRLIASGGVGSEEDLVALTGLKNLYGAIVGKALYDGKIDLAQATRNLSEL